MKNNNKGFSLVELIVVIAIMAILAAVAVVSFSLYIPKAQQAGDKQTISDVEDALTLYFYSNPNEFTGGYVVLAHKDSGKTPTADEFGEAAMVAAFGEDWKEKVFLQYEEWNGEYSGSSFSGNEAVLMGKVESLTDLLGNTIQATPTLVGDNFKNYMTSELGFSEADLANPDKAADAAVLYVANGTSKLTAEQQKVFQEIPAQAAADDLITGMFNGYKNLYGNSVMGAATTYAMLTAYCQYEDEKAGNTDMMDALGTPDASLIESGSDAEMLAVLNDSIARLSEKLAEGNGLNFNKYWSEVAGNDAAAFVNVMSTVNNQKDQVVDNLGTAGCFTTQELQDIFENYGAGCVTIMAELQEDGTLKITTVPEID